MRPVAELFFSLVFFLFFSYLVAFACASNNGNSANGQHGDGDHGQGGGSPGSQTLPDAASGNGGAMGPDPSHPPQTAVPTDWRLPRPLQDAVIEEQRRAALRLREEMAAADVAAILEAIDTPWPEEKEGGGAEGAPFIFVDPSGFPEPWKVLAPYSVTGGPPFSDPSRERGGKPMIGSGVLGSVQTSRRRSRHRKKGTEGSGGPENVRSEQPEVGGSKSKRWRAQETTDAGDPQKAGDGGDLTRVPQRRPIVVDPAKQKLTEQLRQVREERRRRYQERDASSGDEVPEREERRDTPRPHEAAHQLHETTAGALRPRRRRTVSGDGGTSVTRIILIGGIALFLTIVAGMVLYKMRKRSSSKRKGVQTAYKRRGRSSRKLARSGSESSTADGGTDGKPAPHTPQRFRRAPSSLKKRNE